MDRQIVFIGQIPLDTDMLSTNLNSYIGLAKLSAAVLGTVSLLNNFTCIQTGTPSMSVTVSAGEIYALENIDNDTYGSIPPDTTHAIVKQGVNLNTTTLTCTAPSTVGNSVNYLVQIGFSETDTGSEVLPYYNASDPSQAWSGPNNSGTPNYTIRTDSCNVNLKQGVQAPTGTQVTPSPDSGFLGAFVITVAHGATTIINSNISVYSSANFINETLTQKISQATADLRYAQITSVQNSQYVYGVDSSVSANTVTVNVSPALTSYVAGQTFSIKIANTNTGATTININTLGAKNITHSDGTALAAGDIISGGISILSYDGTAFQVKTPESANFYPSAVQNNSYIYGNDGGSANAYTLTTTPAVAAYTAGLGVIVKIANANTGAGTLNVSALGTKNIKLTDGSNPSANDLVAGMEAWFLYDGTNFQLMNPTNQAKFQGLSTYVADSGSVNAYAATLAPAWTSYVAGQKLSVKIANSNTTQTPTLNVSGLGAKTIVPSDTSNLTTIWPGNLQTGQVCNFIYDGTNFQLLNPYIDKSALKVPNLIIGGEFSINPWQRNTTFSAVANGTNTADRFKWIQSGSGVVTISQAGDAPTVSQSGILTNNCLSIATTTADGSITAGDYYAIQQSIEGFDFLKIAQIPFMISFWVKATVTGVYCISGTNSGGDRTFVAEYTVTNSNTWQYVCVPVIASPSAGTWSYTNVGAGLVLTWAVAAGSTYQTTAGSWQTGYYLATSNQVNGMSSTSNIFKLQLIQVEPGLNATAFKTRTLAEEIVLCQRFYEKSYGFSTPPGTASASNGALSAQTSTGSNAVFNMVGHYRVSKRTQPTITFYSTNSGTSARVYNATQGSDFTVNANINGGINSTGYPALSSSLTQNDTCYSQWTSDAEF